MWLEVSKVETDISKYLESSFLGPLISLKGLTDISYNGHDFFYLTNETGRKKAEDLASSKEVGDLLRQVSNMAERSFSYSSPILDVSFGRYRLNAVFTNLTRFQNEKTFSFSLRLASPKCSILSNPYFFSGDSEKILLDILAKKESLVIGGKTGCGKTELEKWCLLHLAPSTRVLVIDNVEELDLLQNEKIDLTTWVTNEKIIGGDFASLVKNALRNNPDYIMVAEARGKEMLDALVSVMSGHPIITSIHALDVVSLPKRMARLAMMGNEHLYLKDLEDDIIHHIPYYVYLDSEVKEGVIVRYIKSIGTFGSTSKKMKIIFRRENL
jgi:pilus assembly protein CpaF